MSTPTTLRSTSTTGPSGELLISADSHVMEPYDLWVERLPAKYRDAAPRYNPPEVGVSFQGHPGGHDPRARVTEMAEDGVSAEVLYPTLGLNQFGIDDAALQEACFRVYNDWLIEYCQFSLERLVGVPSIAIYDVDHAVKELERYRKAGLQGSIIWQAPHPDLPLYSDHYNKFWDACQEMDAPVSLHILTGHNYSRDLGRKGVEAYRGSTNLKLFDAANGLFDLIHYGVLERYPRLKIVYVENEIGWVPFFLQQWDYYYRRFLTANPMPITQAPSEYFKRQVYLTFFNDSVGGHNLEWCGVDNYMWSNDFPHPNSTWPHSRKIIARDLGHLSDEARAKLVRENVVRLYNLAVPEPV